MKVTVKIILTIIVLSLPSKLYADAGAVDFTQSFYRIKQVYLEGENEAEQICANATGYMAITNGIAYWEDSGNGIYRIDHPATVTCECYLVSDKRGICYNHISNIQPRIPRTRTTRRTK